jgi:hypothetical protein
MYYAKKEYGMKVLGVYMGSSEYIQENLDAKLVKLAKVKDDIINFSDKQVRNLMLRWSFCAKINHLLRTTPPTLIQSFVGQFTRLKLEILCSLINDKHYPAHNFTPDSLPDRVKQQSLLHINEGGLGLHDHFLTSHAAYLASLSEAQSYIVTIHKQFDNVLNNNSSQHLRIAEFWKSISVISKYDTTFAFDSIAKLKPDGVDRTLQNAIMRLTRQKVLKDFESTLQHADDLGWLKCLQGNYAGLWLERCPTASRFHIDAKKFSVALRYRLRLSMPFINEGSYCTCKSRSKLVDGENSNKLDIYGYHLTILCGKDGYRNKIHDGIVHTINACCHANGVYTQLEPRNLFHMHTDDNNKRPDLLLMNPPGFSNDRVAIDVSMTHCIPKSTTRAQAANFHKDSTASKQAEKEKNKKFCSDCKLAGIGFHALIFESTGRPSNEMEKFLSRVMANSIEAKGMNPEATLRYWMTAISVNIQLNIANSILNRAININASRQSKIYHKDSCPDHIHLSNSIDGSQLTHSQLLDNSYAYHDIDISHDNYGCDDEIDLFIPTPIDHSSNSNTQDTNMSSLPSHPSSPLNNSSYHPPYILQSHPTSPISPASPTLPITQHQHDTSSPLSSSSVHLKRSRPIALSPLSPTFIHYNKKYKNNSNNVYDSANAFNIHDNVEDTNNNTYIS